MTWPLVTVDQIKAKKRYSLVGGPFGSNLVTKDYRDDGVPVIRGGNVPGDKAFSLMIWFLFLRRKPTNCCRTTLFRAISW